MLRECARAREGGVQLQHLARVIIIRRIVSRDGRVTIVLVLIIYVVV